MRQYQLTLESLLCIYVYLSICVCVFIYVWWIDIDTSILINFMEWQLSAMTNHHIRIWLNPKRMHKWMNEYILMVVYMVHIYQYIANYFQHRTKKNRKKFSNLQNENGPSNRYGIKNKEWTWPKSDEFVCGILKMGKWLWENTFPIIQTHSSKTISKELQFKYAQRMLWKLKVKGKKSWIYLPL